MNRKVLTVSQVNRLVSEMLARQFPDIWIEGEVSNFRPYPSGHLYFTLKDATAQISAVCFRTAAQLLKFELKDGMQVIGYGRVELYAPSGKFQVILDRIEPKGKGALQEAFEQLKQKLTAEGLFEPARKRPIPVLPEVVGVVTSPSGAVIHDIIRTLRLHDARFRVLLYPVQVQGEQAAGQIVQGIQDLNARGDVEVIVVARGGGSIEDLWPFNEEVVARAIAGSTVPVISGVGHETDFTTADFVADVRAATPTAAAQLLARGREEFLRTILDSARLLLDAIQELLFSREQRLNELIRHRAFDVLRHRLRDEQSRVFRLLTRVESSVRDLRHQTEIRLRTLVVQIAHPVEARVKSDVSRWRVLSAELNALSPLASLDRGYALCQKPDGALVSSIRQVQAGDSVDVRVKDGRMECEVKESKELAKEKES